MATKDLTTYTETDASNKLTVTADTVVAAALQRQHLASVVKDYTADFFDALDIDFTIRCTGGAGADFAGTMLTVNTCNSNASCGTYDAWVCMYYGDATNSTLALYRGPYITAETYAALTGTTYYCTIVRSAGSDTIQCLVYDDTWGGNLVDTLSRTGYSTTKYRYHYALQHRYVAANTDQFDGTLGYFNFNEAAAAVFDHHNRMARR